MSFYTFFQILIVSLAATSAMTLFSYAISTKYRDENYKEPLLLSQMLAQIKFNMPIVSKKTLGWLLYFVIGFLFVLVYHLLWLYDILDFSVRSAFLLGITSGVIGVISWIIMLKITKCDLSKDFKGYYLQMFISRIIFALYAAAVYYILLTVFLAVYSPLTS